MIDSELLKEKYFRKNLYNLINPIIEQVIYDFENYNEYKAAIYVIESFLNRNYRLYNLRKTYGNIDKVLRHKLRKQNIVVYNTFMDCYSKMNTILHHFYRNQYFCPKNYKDLDKVILFKKYFKPYAAEILGWYISDKYIYDNGEDNWIYYLDKSTLVD